MDTKTRILETARTLFNDQGTGAVSTNHIAQAAGISPGNLYYHYRNKEAIIRAVCAELFATTGAMFALEPGRLPTLDDVQRWVRLNFEVTWQYAFVYRELPTLLRHDPELAQHYRAVRQRGYAGFRFLIEALSEAGVLRRTILEAGATDLLADLCWLITEQWLTALDLAGYQPDAAAMQRGIALMLFAMQPYLVSPHPDTTA